MNVWFTEYQSKNLSIGLRVGRTLFHKKSQFQDVLVTDTFQFGRMLTLDDVIMTTIADEFVYHEMIAHVGLNTLKTPRRVLVVGGGDGGTVREVLKHDSVEEVTLVEIDAMVIEASREHLPELSCGFNDPRARIIIDDGIKHVRENKSSYDMIIVDCTDPVGPAVGLFSAEFYSDVHDALTSDGLFVAQTESPFFNGELISRIHHDVGSIFPLARLYLANVPTYPGGLWCFTIGSKKHDPLEVDFESLPSLGTRYYSPRVHRASFVLPPFVQALVR